MKAISEVTLDAIVTRLKGCRSLLYAMKESAETSITPVEALDAVGVLLTGPIDTLKGLLEENGGHEA